MKPSKDYIPIFYILYRLYYCNLDIIFNIYSMFIVCNVLYIMCILQTILSVVTKDHYTIDVIHTWIFIYAIFNRLNFIY